MLGEVACSDLVSFFKVFHINFHMMKFAADNPDFHSESRTPEQRHHFDFLTRFYPDQPCPHHEHSGELAIERLCPLRHQQ